MPPDVSKVVKKETAIHHLTWDSRTGWVGLTKSTYGDLLNQDIIGKPGIDIYFLSELYTDNEKEGLGENKALCEELSEKFQIPSFFWRKYSWNVNGFCGNRYNPPNETAKSPSYSTYFRFLIKEVNAPKKGPIKYDWQFLSFFSFWCKPSTDPEKQPNAKIQPIPGRLILLCFDHTPKMRDIMCNAFKTVDAGTSREDPFALHAALIDALVQQYEKALWGFQAPIRNIEKTRNENLPPKEEEEAREGFREKKDIEQAQHPTLGIIRTRTGGPELDYTKLTKTRDEERIALLYRYTHMHELGRHIIHASEVLAAAIVTLTTMLEGYEQFFKTEVASDLSEPAKTRLISLVPSTIMFNKNFLSCLELRSNAFNQRLHNEINLAFNSLAAWDSNISAQILKESKDESKSFTLMVSILTVLFLPGTFISGFFGMNFFTYDAETMKTSHSIWIFFLISSVVTVVGLVLFIWLYGWTKLRNMLGNLARDSQADISPGSNSSWKDGR